MIKHHKIAGLIIRDKELLVCHKRGEPHYMIPGGKVEGDETVLETLRRELKEELCVKVERAEYFGTHEAIHFKDKNRLIVMDSYLVSIVGDPKPDNEIDEFIWIDSDYERKGIKVASIDHDYIIPELKKRGLIL